MNENFHFESAHLMNERACNMQRELMCPMCKGELKETLYPLLRVAARYCRTFERLFLDTLGGQYGK